MHWFSLALLVLSAVSPANAGTGCGAAPSFTNVTSAKSTNGDALDTYTLTATVRNIGSQNQKANVLQSAAIYLDGVKNGQKSIPPLRAGRSYSFAYDVRRAQGAVLGSTSVWLVLVAAGGGAAAPAACAAASETFRLTL